MAPSVTWGLKGRYFILGVGDNAVEKILERAATAEPEWLAEVKRQLPVERRSTLTYLDAKGATEPFFPLLGERGAFAARGIVEALGLGNVTALTSVTGLDDDGFVSRSLLAVDGELQGVLAMLGAEPLSADDLAPIPADATFAVAKRADVDQAIRIVLEVAEKIEPRARAEIVEALREIEIELGINPRDDFLKPLGDVWRIYNSPTEGGLMITGATLVVDVDDPDRLEATLEKLVATATREFGDRGPRIEQFEYAGQDVYFFNARNNDFPLAPAWCLTDDKLIVSTFPQPIKAYLSRGSDFESLATVPEVAGLFASGEGPLVVSYLDVPELFEMVYPLVPFFVQIATGELQKEGVDLDVSILPSAPAIGRHLRPVVGAMRHIEAGIEWTSRQTLPGGNIGSAVPVLGAFAVPAVFGARQSARRASSMNYIKQIGLAMHNYHDVYGHLPAAYTTDDDGKPLLSWRVHILPYVEEMPLYKEFHLDEPWDSEHNRKLIPRMPQAYKAPGSKAAEGKTNYVTPRGDNTVFPGSKEIGFRDITDGMSNTIMTIEVSDQSAVTWTAPDDFEVDMDNPIKGIVGLRPGGFNAGLCDGSVRFISEDVDTDTLKNLFIRNDGEVIGQF